MVRQLLKVSAIPTTGAAIAIIHWATWRYKRDLDEMHQRIMLEAIVFSFFATMTLVVGAGVAGLARNTSVNILLVDLTAEFLRGLALAGTRYR